MPTWLRVCALLLVVAWSMYRGIRIEKRIHARLIRAARASAARGLAYTGIVMFFVCMVGPVATVAAVLVIDR